MPGDNFHVEVASEGREHFELAVWLAFANAPGGKATHYVTPLPEGSCLECANGNRTTWKNRQPIEYPCPECGGTGKRPPKPGMILLWNEGMIRGLRAYQLPFPLTRDAAVEFLWAWLKTADYGEKPDHDGSNSKGFIVTTGNYWGHVEGCDYAFIGVYPDWQMYGK